MDLLTIDETAAMLRVPVDTLRWWRHRGEGPRGFRVGRHVLYERSEITRWLREQQANDARTPARP